MPSCVRTRRRYSSRMTKASTHARTLADLRWKKTTAEQRREISRKLHAAKKAKKLAEAAP